MKVKIKKIVPQATIPQYSKPGDAGMDLVATSINVIDSTGFGYYQYGTGLSIEIPEGYVGLIFPRSSISNTGMILSNSVAVIDSGYRGEIMCRFKYIPDCTYYQVGGENSSISYYSPSGYRMGSSRRAL